MKLLAFDDEDGVTRVRMVGEEIETRILPEYAKCLSKEMRLPDSDDLLDHDMGLDDGSVILYVSLLVAGYLVPIHKRRETPIGGGEVEFICKLRG